MGHDHAHGHAHGRALGIALALTCTVLVAELAGAWWSGSLALLSDAAHMFTDAAALGLSLAAQRLGRRPPDERRTFGYNRFEVLAALVNALLLLAAALYIVYEAWRRLHEPAPIASGVMLGIAVLGLVVNLVGMRVLGGGQAENMNMRGAYLEVWSDMVGSLGVIAAAVAIRFTGREWIDSAVAIAIGLWVLPRTVSLLRASTNVLLEGVPEGLELADLERRLRECPEVDSVHDLHVWSLGSGQVSLTVHAVVEAGVEPGDLLLGRIRSLLVEEFDIHHSTVQLEQVPCGQHAGAHRFSPHAH